MKISTRLRYGIRAMVELAMNDGANPLSAREVAAQQGLPLKYLETLLGLLKTAGLVRAMRGPAGGYVLTRAPEDIAVSDIVAALEGNLLPVECMARPGSCEAAEVCAARLLWNRLQAAVDQVLADTTLAEMAEQQQHMLGHQDVLMKTPEQGNPRRCR